MLLIHEVDNVPVVTTVTLVWVRTVKWSVIVLIQFVLLSVIVEVEQGIKLQDVGFVFGINEVRSAKSGNR